MSLDCCKVLLISQEEGFFKRVKDLLSSPKRGPYEVLWAADGSDIKESLPVDVILSESVAAVELVPAASMTPVILLTPTVDMEAGAPASERSDRVVDVLEREELNPALLEHAVRRAMLQAAGWKRQETRLDQRVEARTRDLSRMLADTLENIGEGFLVLDQDWIITYINARAAQHSQFDQAGSVGKSLWDAFQGLGDSPEAQYFHEAMESRNPVRFDFKHPTQSLWYEVSIYPNDDGVSVFCNDKSLEKRAEQETERLVAELHAAHRSAEKSAADARQTAREIRTTSTRLEAILNSLNTAVIVYNLEGVIEQANAFAIAMLGFDPIHMPRATLLRRIKFFDKENQPVGAKDLPYRRAEKGEMVFNVPMTLINQRGRKYALLISALPLYIGRESTGVVTIWNDITNRERMQLEIREKNAIVGRQKELLGKIFEVSPVSIAVLEGPEHRFSLFNPAYLALLEGSVNILGKTFQEVFPARPETLAVIDRVYTTGEPFDGMNIPVRHSQKEDAPIRYFSQIYTPLFAPEGEVESVLAMSLETTEQLTMAGMVEAARARLADEQQRRRIQVEVQRRMMDQSEMERTQIARDLHEGPLQDLIALDFGLVEAMGMDGKEERINKMRWIQEGLQHEIRELRAYCNDLRPPVLAPFGLEKAIRSYLDSLRTRHPETAIHAYLTPDGKRLDESTRMRLFRVFQSIVSNVYRHASATQLWVELRINDHELTLSIQDNGVGFIVPGDWVEIAREGRFGLLSASERIASIGGNISIESQPGAGTKVIVNLPI